MDISRDFTTDFDHLDPTFATNIESVTAELRLHHPVTHTNRHDGFWILSRYDDIQKALLTDKTFSSKNGTAIPAVERDIPALPVETDPPDHTLYRSFLTPWLAARKVSTYEPVIRRFTRQLINDFIEEGTCDIIASLAALLPASIIPLVMGIDAKEWPALLQSMKIVIKTAQTNDTEENIKARQSLMHYMLKATERRRIKPRNDFLTSLVAVSPGEKALDSEEIVSLILIIITAGLETTTNAIGNLLLCLCEYENNRECLSTKPELIPLFVEECLRYNAPLQYVGRNIAKDLSIDGKELKTDEKTLLLLGSANHDEAIFPDASQFLIKRQPQRHLSFGYGIHFCIGAPLARLEMRIVTEEILRRLPDYQLCDAIKKRSFSVGQVYGITTLPIMFTPGKVEAIPL